MGWADGRRALVTGAGRGMGHATAERLLADGAGVIAVDVDGAGLADLEAAGAVTIVADLADTEARQRVIDEGRSGRLDFLVNAAAILHPRPFWEVTEADFRKVFAVNLESAWFLSLGLGRHLTEGGAIVNFSSPSARNAGTIEAAVYGATKTAIQSMTRSFAHALAPRRLYPTGGFPIGASTRSPAYCRAPLRIVDASPPILFQQAILTACDFERFICTCCTGGATLLATG